MNRENCWPMILLGGASETGHDGIGAFQEWPQLASVRDCVKYSARPASVQLIPRHLERAVRSSVYGRPGPTYIDLPGDLLQTRIPTSSIELIPAPAPPPVILPEQKSIQHAATLIKNSAKPLVIIGKGAAYGRAEQELLNFVMATNLPILATPMGKGVIPDDNPQLVAAARSTALEGADLVLLIGARLNWMLHFGHAPRWCQNVKVIQIDLCAEELHNSAAVALQGDIRATVAALSSALTTWRYPDSAPWWQNLKLKCDQNVEATKALSQDANMPLNYYAAFDPICKFIDKDTYIVSEGRVCDGVRFNHRELNKRS